MKTQGICIEHPDLSKPEILNAVTANFPKSLPDSDFLLIARNGKGIEGFLQLVPATFSGQNIVSFALSGNTSSQILKPLITEALMYSWEIGFDAVICSEHAEILKEMGFERLKLITDSTNPVYGYELSWKGLTKLNSLDISLYEISKLN